MIRKRVHFWECMARELGYKILTLGIDWMHCQVKNNVCVIIKREKHTNLFVVHVEIMAGETDEDFERYYYGLHSRENLKEDIEKFIKGREEDIKLRKATERSS